MPDHGEPLAEVVGEPPVGLLVPNQDPQTAKDWSLVLASQGMSSRSVLRDGRLVLEVGHGQIDAARTTIERYLRENPVVPDAEPAPEPETDAVAWAGPLFGIAILATFAATGGRELSPELFDRANADAARILAGQWWRCVTALCLHSDLPHALGNALVGSYLVHAVCRQLGSGLGIAAILSSGALGNAINAYAYTSGHLSVGASTAVFGAIGVLAGCAATRPRTATRQRPRWVPFAAGLGLLAMLGTSGVRVDIWAHFFGLLAGCGIGASVGTWIARNGSGGLSSIAQWAFGVGAIAVLVECWTIALAR